MAPAAADQAALDAVVVHRFSFPMRRSAWRTLRKLAMAWKTPWHAATRVPAAAEHRHLQPMLEDFAPDLLWLDGTWFGRVVLVALQRGQARLAYHSHNIEHQYLARQADVVRVGATGWRSAWHAGAWAASSGN